MSTQNPQATATDGAYRRAAVSRIWKAIQPLAPSPAPQAAHVAQKKDKGAKGVPGTAQAPTRPKIVKAARVAKANNAPATARQGSKKAIVINMLKQYAEAPGRHHAPGHPG